MLDKPNRRYLIKIVPQCILGDYITSTQVDPSGYWWPPTYSTCIPTIVSFSFSVSLIVAQFTIFGRFLDPELLEPF